MRFFKFILPLSFIFLFSCSNEKDNIVQIDIIGDATPIYLKFDSENEIHLLDYFIEINQIKSVELPSELNYNFNKETGVIKVKGNLKSPYANMRVNTNTTTYDLVLRSILMQEYFFEFDSKGKNYTKLKIKGTFNNWDTERNILKLENGIYKTKLLLMPGKYQYVFVEGEKEFRDPNNQKKVANGIGGYNSLLEFGDLNKKKPFVTSTIDGNRLVIRSSEDLSYLVYVNNQLIQSGELNKKDYTQINLKDLGSASSVRIYSYNKYTGANDILIPVKDSELLRNSSKLSRTDLQSQVMYEVMVDRFNNGNKENDDPLNIPEVKAIADYNGGDLKGITDKINSGYFQDLGVNSLWITPIVQNPLDAWGEWNSGGVYSKFSGYHGYWPLITTKIDHRFGTEDELIELIDVAHKNNISIIMDYVANHVHEDSKLIRDNPDWKTELVLEDGSLNLEKWDSERLTTWFDKFLPTLDLENEVVVEAMTDTALFWLEKYELDGLRHDACKHIPLNYWRTLTRKIKNNVVIEKGRQIYQVGETYSGPELVASYVNSGMLQGQFDFNLYDQSLRSFAQKDESLKNLALRLDESLSYYGYHHLMGNISGNHDKARVISYIDGSVTFEEDTKLAGWTREISNKDDSAYDILAQIIAFTAVVPGVPVIYYGDEIGMPGGNDPDNRRMMVFDELEEVKVNLRNTTQMLMNFRRTNMALMYGDTDIIFADDDLLVISRSYLGENTLAVFNKGKEGDIVIDLPFYYIDKLQSLKGNNIENSYRKIKLNISKGGFDILYSKRK